MTRLSAFNMIILPLLVFVPLEQLFPARRSQGVFRRGWFTDLTYIIANRPLIEFGLIAIIATVGDSAHAMVPSRVHAALYGQPIWFQLVQIFLIADLGFYVAHRLFHAVPGLWRFHAIHHSIEKLDWLAAARVHPIDQILTKAASLLPPFVLGYSDGALAIFAVVYFWHSFLLHANVPLAFGPLNGLIASPRFHHWHHSSDPSARDKNFGAQLSLFDKLFGTYYLPPDRAAVRFGIGDAVPGTYLRNLVFPLMPRRRPRADRLSASPAI